MRIKTLLVVCLVLGFLVAMPAGALVVQGDTIATLTKFLGDVQFRRKASNDWALVKRGMFFYEGDKIRTKIDGRAEISFSEGTVLRIANETELEFEPLGDKKKRSIFVSAGKVWNKVTKGTNFEIESVHGVASVKGTEYVLEVGSNMQVWVAEGFVEVKNEQGSVLAGRNTRTVIVKDEAPANTAVSLNVVKDHVIQEVKAAYKVVVTAPNDKLINRPFDIYVNVKEIATDRSASVPISVKLSRGGQGTMVFSLDGVAWSESIDFVVNEGRSIIKAKVSTPGMSRFVLTSAVLQGIELGLDVADIREKNYIIDFTDPVTNKPQKLLLELIKK